MSAGEAVPLRPPWCTPSDRHSPRSLAGPTWHSGCSPGRLHSHTRPSSSSAGPRFHLSRGTNRGQAGEEPKGPGGWETGVDCQSPVSSRAGQRLLNVQTPFSASVGGGQRPRPEPPTSQARSRPHSRPSFTLNFPALTGPSGTRPGTRAASLIRLQELSGRPCWCSVVGGCVPKQRLQFAISFDGQRIFCSGV